MAISNDPIRFLHDLQYDDLSVDVRERAEMCILDLIGVGLGGATTSASRIVREQANKQFSGALSMLFDGRPASAAGVALAGGMTIDALDGHDGYNPAKGHVGCGVFPAALAFGMAEGETSGTEFITTITVGYELGSRLATTLHATAGDYHTSGAWVAIAVAALGARTLKLDPETTRHALGIAEYHGPRSQMMRVIDHPTMLKDGSGWGAMAGIFAAYIACDGFTGAPALTINGPAWRDLGDKWLILDQYFKPYPVCRWAHSPIEAVLDLRRKHNLTSHDVASLDVYTFHEAARLATNTPKTTEEAQYSTSFPTAVALVRGTVGPSDVSDKALKDPEVLRLSEAMTIHEDAHANRAFPDTRLARVVLTLKSGETLESGWKIPKWDAAAPPTKTELRQKFHAFADPVVGHETAVRIEDAVNQLQKNGLSPLIELITQPIE